MRLLIPINWWGLLSLSVNPPSTHADDCRNPRARYILSFTDSDEANAEVALQTMQLIPFQTTLKETAIIQILNPKLYLMIRKQAFATDRRSGFQIEFFNQYVVG
jgi:hypothetical protein